MHIIYKFMQNRLGLSFLFKVDFEDVVGEPASAESIKCVWGNTRCAFDSAMFLCYRGLSTVCGLPIACLCGMKYACLSFNQVWCVTPCVHAFKMWLHSTSSVYSSCVKCLCEPLMESIALVASKVRVSRD